MADSELQLGGGGGGGGGGGFLACPAQLFSTKIGKGGEGCRPQNILGCRVGREERRLSMLRKRKLHTFTIFFLLLFGFV